MEPRLIHPRQPREQLGAAAGTGTACGSAHTAHECFIPTAPKDILPEQHCHVLATELAKGRGDTVPTVLAWCPQGAFCSSCSNFNEKLNEEQQNEKQKSHFFDL